MLGVSTDIVPAIRKKGLERRTHAGRAIFAVYTGHLREGLRLVGGQRSLGEKVFQEHNLMSSHRLPSDPSKASELIPTADLAIALASGMKPCWSCMQTLCDFPRHRINFESAPSCSKSTVSVHGIRRPRTLALSVLLLHDTKPPVGCVCMINDDCLAFILGRSKKRTLIFGWSE